MTATPPPPPPPPQRERRAPTTGAALTLAAVAITGWLISMVVLSGLSLMLWTSNAVPSFFSADRGTATLVAGLMLVVAAGIYLAPRFTRPKHTDESLLSEGP